MTYLCTLWTDRNCILSSTTSRSRRRRRCGKRGTWRSGCPTTKIFRIKAVWGRSSECPSWIWAGWNWVTAKDCFRDAQTVWMPARWFIHNACIPEGTCTVIECQIDQGTQVKAESEAQSITTEKLGTGPANSMSLRPVILTGTIWWLWLKWIVTY